MQQHREERDNDDAAPEPRQRAEETGAKGAECDDGGEGENGHDG